MRVLVLTGQSDRSEAHLLTGLRELGARLEVMMEPSSEFRPVLEGAGIPVRPLICAAKLHPAAIRSIYSKLQEGPFDILQAFTGRTVSNAWLASLGFKIKRVAYRGTCGHLSRWDPSAWITYLNPAWHRIICVSSAVERYLTACGVPPERLTTIYKGHDVSWYQGSPADALAEFGIPPEALTVACAANMRPVKGVDVLLKAAALLPKHEEVHLLLLGEVRDSAISRLCTALPPHIKPHLPGFRPDAVSLLGAAQVFVMPSRAREGLPKAVIEAMAQSRAVIVSDAGGLPELVRHNIDGLVVPAGDAQALAQALTRLMGDAELRKRLGGSAKERIKNDFSIVKTVNRVFTLYQELMRAS